MLGRFFGSTKKADPAPVKTKPAPLLPTPQTNADEFTEVVTGSRTKELTLFSTIALLEKFDVQIVRSSGKRWSFTANTEMPSFRLTFKDGSAIEIKLP